MRRLPNELGILIVLIVVGLVFALLSNQFFTTGNLFTMLLNVTVIALLSLGQTFVLLTGGIDLSVGSGIALSGVLAAMVLQSNGSLWEAVAVALLSTLALGLVNGAVIHYVKVPPFITTFATMSVTASIPMILTQANPIAIVKQGFSQIGGGFVGPIPVPVLILGILAMLAWLFLTRTSLGVHIYATGGNRDAARLAGVNTAKVDLLVYLTSGLMSGLCGLIDASRLMSGFPTAGSGTSLFFSIAGAVVGGVSLFGGVGSIVGALIGAVLIGTIMDGLNIINVSSYWQPLVIGLIILIAVTVDTLRTSQRLRLPSTEVLQRFWKKDSKPNPGTGQG